ncbi:MAG: AmmeMemoRadiSam system protein B [Rhodospirillales bacterium]
MTEVRQPAVAGTFYPGEARDLDAAIQSYVSQVTVPGGPAPKAIIAPHAGYIYSGPVAATAYARLKPAADRITRVVLLGPCHRVPVRGLALSSAGAFATPLGHVPVDGDAARRVLALAQVQVFDATHADEHSLEVHLPFLQVVLDKFSVVPLVVGDASAEEVAQVLELLWGGPETLIVVSSDLSHYLGYEDARRMDQATCRAIENLDPAGIGRDQACGRVPVRGLLALARRRRLAVATVDLRNSGDTAGPRDQVVGYGAWVFLEEGAGRRAAGDAGGPGEQAAQEDVFAGQTRALLDRHGATLLHLAAASIEFGLDHDRELPVNAAEHHDDLNRNGASFVTLKRDGKLRGCIGTYTAHRPLVVDVVKNGFEAAFKDPRFSRLVDDDLEGLILSVSVLSAPSPMTFADEADLTRQLRPGTDGLIIQDAERRALFLPAVWETVPKPRDFLRHLKAKAKLGPDHWSAGFRAWRFIAAEISARDLEDPGAIWSGHRRG